MPMDREQVGGDEEQTSPTEDDEAAEDDEAQDAGTTAGGGEKTGPSTFSSTSVAVLAAGVELAATSLSKIATLAATTPRTLPLPLPATIASATAGGEDLAAKQPAHGLSRIHL